MKDIKHIYVTHVDEYIGAYKPGKCEMIIYARQADFSEFILSLREDYPNFKPVYVLHNEGIKRRIKKQIDFDRSIRPKQSNVKER